jgi:hypothetical protein
VGHDVRCVHLCAAAVSCARVLTLLPVPALSRALAACYVSCCCVLLVTGRRAARLASSWWRPVRRLVQRPGVP